ncbi:MAG: hypothetical protein K2X93_06875 [Candidatus Obscuribacterales bacterium]|nr:hypothetical protein [Candidatus Obscuribacterales bacterium]
MTILIGKFEFDGPFSVVDDLEERPGLYAVLHYEHGEYELIHVSQADNIKNTIEVSPSAYSQLGGAVLIAACYTSGCGSRERNAMIEEIQAEFDNQQDDEYSTPQLANSAS